MIDLEPLSKINLDSIRILQNPHIPNYVDKQIFVPRSRKKRIINKCKKKYTMPVINDSTFWLDNTSVFCSELIYGKILNLKWREH